MYCRKCGCKINAGEKKCSDCGTEVVGIEYSGGFWGLVGEKEKKIDMPQIEESEEMEAPIRNTEQPKKLETYVERKPQERTQKKSNEELIAMIRRDSKIKKKYKSRMQLLVGAVAVLLLVCLIQTVRASLLSQKYKSVQTQYNNLNRNYQELNTKYKKLDNQYEDTQLDELIVPGTESSSDETSISETEKIDSLDDTERSSENKNELETSETYSHKSDE